MAVPTTQMLAAWLLVRPLVVLAYVAASPDQMDIETVAANLHAQVLESQRSLQALGMPPLPDSYAPSFTEVGDSTSAAGLPDADQQLQLATRRLQEAVEHQRLRQQEVSTYQQQLANQQVALQQQLASARAGLRRSTYSGAAQPAALLSLGQQQQTAAKPLALPQTGTLRQKNPWLASLLLAPVLYGYSVIIWVLVLLFTGASSAFCMYAGKPGNQPLAADATRAPRRLSTYFQYPGSFLKRPAFREGAKAMAMSGSEVSEDEEEEGVEAWVKVPVRPRAPRSEWPGYFDDDEGEVERCVGRQGYSPPTSRYQPYGIVDER